MSWYYAENNERRGPIEDAQFDLLVAQGTIRPDTLVWREGLTNWVRLTESDHRPGVADAAAATTRTSEEMGMCSESGRIFPRSELVEIDGRLVSAEYKHIVLQRIREGVGTTGAAADPEALGQLIERRGYDISVGECIARGWALVKGRFWLTVGATFLTMLITQAAAMIPIVGPIVVFGPLTAGLYWLMILLLRNEPAGVGDVFIGFSRGFGQFLGFTAVLFGAFIACSIPAGIAFGIGMATSPNNPPMAMMGMAGLLGFAGFLAMMYLWVSWIFGLALIIDKQVEFWPAMKLSKRVVGLHWWKIFGIILCTVLIMMMVMVCVGLVVAIVLGILTAMKAGQGAIASAAVLFGALFVLALLAVMPLSYATVAVAYEAIFGQPERR